MSDIEQKRQFVLSLSHTQSWKKKVLKMSEAQVIAIYLREKDKPPKPKNKESGQDDIPF